MHAFTSVDGVIDALTWTFDYGFHSAPRGRDTRDAERPAANVIAERAGPLIESGELPVLFAGDGRDGFAELRFRPSLYTGALDAYLEELYAIPSAAAAGSGERCSSPRCSSPSFPRLTDDRRHRASTFESGGVRRLSGPERRQVG
jgi:hypothetical protein